MHVIGDVIVDGGVTLTILPGTSVKFDKGTGLQVSGELVARGTKDAMSTFTSIAASPERGDWNGIYITGNTTLDHIVVEYSKGLEISQVEHPTVTNSVMRHNSFGIGAVCRDGEFRNNIIIDNERAGIEIGYSGSATIDNNTLENNGYGILASPSGLNGFINLTITNNKIRNNEIGIMGIYGTSIDGHNNVIANNNYGIKISLVAPYANQIFEDNQIYNNTYGIYAQYATNPLIIRNNQIFHNELGIYVDSVWMGADISQNALYENTRYNFYNNTTNPITVENNYWGSTDPSVIDNTIYDNEENPTKGPVDFEPFLTQNTAVIRQINNSIDMSGYSPATQRFFSPAEVQTAMQDAVRLMFELAPDKQQQTIDSFMYVKHIVFATNFPPEEGGWPIQSGALILNPQTGEKDTIAINPAFINSTFTTTEELQGFFIMTLQHEALHADHFYRGKYGINYKREPDPTPYLMYPTDPTDHSFAGWTESLSHQLNDYWELKWADHIGRPDTYTARWAWTALHFQDRDMTGRKYNGLLTQACYQLGGVLDRIAAKDIWLMGVVSFDSTLHGEEYLGSGASIEYARLSQVETISDDGGANFDVRVVLDFFVNGQWASAMFRLTNERFELLGTSGLQVIYTKPTTPSALLSPMRHTALSTPVMPTPMGMLQQKPSMPQQPFLFAGAGMVFSGGIGGISALIQSLINTINRRVRQRWLAKILSAAVVVIVILVLTVPVLILTVACSPAQQAPPTPPLQTAQPIQQMPTVAPSMAIRITDIKPASQYTSEAERLSAIKLYTNYIKFYLRLPVFDYEIKKYSERYNKNLTPLNVILYKLAEIGVFESRNTLIDSLNLSEHPDLREQVIKALGLSPKAAEIFRTYGVIIDSSDDLPEWEFENIEYALSITPPEQLKGLSLSFANVQLLSTAQRTETPTKTPEVVSKVVCSFALQGIVCDKENLPDARMTLHEINHQAFSKLSKEREREYEDIFKGVTTYITRYARESNDVKELVADIYSYWFLNSTNVINYAKSDPATKRLVELMVQDFFIAQSEGELFIRYYIQGKEIRVKLPVDVKLTKDITFDHIVSTQQKSETPLVTSGVPIGLLQPEYYFINKLKPLPAFSYNEISTSTANGKDSLKPRESRTYRFDFTEGITGLYMQYYWETDAKHMA
ncbi:MAG: hypothetical protein FJZ16_06190, partial [Candidatus Omnitrophica bacterium]|nr:hypothetical protein [Candidatus Omnitrophota bacterium]